MNITIVPPGRTSPDRASDGSAEAERILTDAVVVSVSGEIDIYTGPRLRTELRELFARVGTAPSANTQPDPVSGRPPGIVLDLTEVTFIDSHAVGVLVFGARAARAAGLPYVLVVTDVNILKTFAMMGLSRVIPLHPDLGSAAASLA